MLCSSASFFSGQGKCPSVRPPKRMIWSFATGCARAGSKVLIPPAKPMSPCSKSTFWSKCKEFMNFCHLVSFTALKVSMMISPRASLAWPLMSAARSVDSAELRDQEIEKETVHQHHEEDGHNDQQGTFSANLFGDPKSMAPKAKRIKVLRMAATSSHSAELLR